MPRFSSVASLSNRGISLAISASNFGTVTISGTTTQGQPLTVSNNLADYADGIGTISYQWNSDGVAITNATATTYIPGYADVGTVITVTASYTDDGETDKSVTSAGTASIAGISSSSLWDLTTTLVASDATAYDQLGKSHSVNLSKDGNTILAAAIWADGSGTAETGGSAVRIGVSYIFVKSGSTWSEQAIVYNNPAVTSNLAGSGSGISDDGNTFAVGAQNYDGGGTGIRTGGVWIHARSGTTWTQQALLQASDKATEDKFGSSVAMSGDGNTVAISAPDEDRGGTNSGSVYIFTRSGTTWTEQAKLWASNSSAFDDFGHWGNGVALSGGAGDYLIVGSSGKDTTGSAAGMAYVFTRSGTTWTEQTKFQPSDVAAGDKFGYSVSINGDGNTAAISSRLPNSAGAVYIFTRSGTTWTQQAKLTTNYDINTGYGAGAVDLSSDGNTLVVGSSSADDSGSNTGSLYVFKRSGTTWTQHALIFDNNGNASDFFGFNAGTNSNGTVVVTAAHYADPDNMTNAGQLYVYDIV